MSDKGKLVVLTILALSAFLPWTTRYDPVPVRNIYFYETDAPIYGREGIIFAVFSLFFYVSSILFCLLSSLRTDWRLTLCSGISAMLSSLLWSIGTILTSFGVRVFINPAPGYTGPLSVDYYQHLPSIGVAAVFLSGLTFAIVLATLDYLKKHTEKRSSPASSYL